MHVLNLAPLPSLRSFAAGLIERSRRLSALTAALNSLVIDENNEILDRKKRKRSTDIRYFLTDVRVAMQESTEAVVYDEYLVDDLQNIVKRGEQLLQPVGHAPGVLEQLMKASYCHGYDCYHITTITVL